MSTPNTGSNILGVVAGCALTACVVGTRLIGALIPNGHHGLPAQTPVATATSTILVEPTFVPASPTAQTSNGSTVQRDGVNTDPSPVPPTPVPPTPVPPTPAVPVPDSTTVAGDQATYSNGTYGYRLTYPTAWTAATDKLPQLFAVLAPDNNAAVEVYVEQSAALDTNGLETELVGKLPAFLQQYGGMATSTPTWTMASVDGIPAVVGTFAVSKNGLNGIASASATYANGRVYFVAGVIADQTAGSAAQDDGAVATVMDSFHLR